ncbi:hypothetical protein HK097_008907 [Rhizophlyctis rosea]|uniref:Calmodulin n=1 Tax=Rhizophlyctis rosea TaxID=64517 RepID=A0AAD5S9N6_9FUNG|nr:hypothetical protein HK097_008907 [Rhizophlyctis rosea]
MPSTTKAAIIAACILLLQTTQPAAAHTPAHLQLSPRAHVKRGLDSIVAPPNAKADDHKSTLTKYDKNKDGRLDKQEFKWMLKDIEESNKKHGDLHKDARKKKGKSVKFTSLQDWKTAVGVEDVDDEDFVEELFQHASEAGALDHSTLSALTTSREYRAENLKTYAQTCKVIERKLDSQRSDQCFQQLETSLEICRRDASLLHNLECLTLAPAANICACFPAPPNHPLKTSPSHLHRRSASYVLRHRPGYTRLQSFDEIRPGTPERPRAGPRIGQVNNMIKTFNAVRGSAAAWGRAGVGAALRGAAAVFGAATGPVGVVIMIAITIISVLLELLFNIKFFTCEISSSDFNHPLEKLAAAGDYYPIDFKVWDPKEPEPKCSLLVFWSDQCGYHSGLGGTDGEKARKCTNGGQLVHGNSCKDIGRDGSCGCNGGKCRSMCWKVTGECCCEVLKFVPVPLKGVLKIGNSKQAELDNVSECAQACDANPGCSGFSVVRIQDNKRVLCRIANGPDHEVVQIEDGEDYAGSTTWLAKKISTGTNNGLLFGDIVDTAEKLYKNKAECTKGTEGDDEATIITSALLVASEGLAKLVEVNTNVVNKMISDYKSVSDFKKSVSTLAALIANTLTDFMSTFKTFAYFTNMEGLKAVAALTIYLNYKNKNIFQEANRVRTLAGTEGIFPGGGIIGGKPTAGIFPNPWRIVSKRGASSLSDDPDADCMEGVECTTNDDTTELGDGNKFDAIPTVFLSTALAVACNGRGSATEFTNEIVRYEWVTIHVVNAGIGDSLVQEHLVYQCKKPKDRELTISEIVSDTINCQLEHRRRVMIDGGNNGAHAAGYMSALQPAVVAGALQNYVADQVLLTHPDQDHYRGLRVALMQQDTDNGLYRYFPGSGVQFFWNNYMSLQSRFNIALASGGMTHSTWVGGMNLLLSLWSDNPQPALSADQFAARFMALTATPNPAKTWRQVVQNDFRFPIPSTTPEQDAILNSQCVAPADGQWTGELLDMWFMAVQRSYLVLDTYRGSAVQPASFPGVNAVSTVLWPSLTALANIYDRQGFGGNNPTRVSQKPLSAARRRRGLNVTEPVAEAKSGKKGNDTVVVDKRETRDSDLTGTQLKNYISIVHDVSHTNPVGTTKFLLTGDAINQSFNKMGLTKNHHFVKAAHHGSKTTGGRSDVSGFINADWFVISGRLVNLNAQDGGHPYHAKYILWVIQEHFKLRPDNLLRLYITDFPSGGWQSSALRIMTRQGFRPEDCNYKVYRTVTAFQFSSQHSRETSSSKPKIWVEGAIEAFPASPKKGTCNTQWDDTENM